MKNGTLLAAVDMGSNSFRLEIGQLQHDHIERREYLKETVRQGNGLDDERNLTPQAMQRGWDCLARFAERLAGFSAHQVRAVATQTLREARNRDEFTSRAAEVLGFPIDVISGPEEARLIFQGVVRLLPQSDERRLIVDIGGRSTELIVGQHFQPQAVASFRLGSVSWSMKYFPNGEFTKHAFDVAEVAAKAVLDAAIDTHQRNSWDTAYGSSGTIGAIVDVLTANGHPPGVVTRDGLFWLQEKLLRSQSADRVKLDGLKDDRRAVIGGGLSVLCALFDLLKIDSMYAALGALRQGVLYDLINREHADTDLRASTVRLLSKKFNIDLPQAQRVSTTAAGFYQQLHHTDPNHGEQELVWAASLHEIGRQISHSGYQIHGAYILDNTDTPGFSLTELHHLGLLVRGHRGKLRKIEIDLTNPVLVQQLLCLRLAVTLCHARRAPECQNIKLDQKGNQFTLHAPAQWAQRYPQSAHLLQEEVQAWQKTGWLFHFNCN